MLLERPGAQALQMQYAFLGGLLKLRQRYPDNASIRAITEIDGTLLRHAKPFAWAPEPAAVVSQRAETASPDAVLSLDLMPEEWPVCFFWFEDRLPFNVPRPEVERRSVETSSQWKDVLDFTSLGGMVVTGRADSMFVTILRRERVEHPLGTIVLPTLMYVIPWAMPLAQIPTAVRDGDNVAFVARWLYTAFTYLQERVLVTTSSLIERHQRKQFAREAKMELLPVNDVQVVTLRRPEPQPHDGGHRFVQWSVQWVVMEHRRRLADGRVVRVKAHVKGPKDRPLKMHGVTTYEVKR